MSNNYYEMQDEHGNNLTLTAFVGKAGANMLQLTVGTYPFQYIHLNKEQQMELMYQISRRLFGEISATD